MSPSSPLTLLALLRTVARAAGLRAPVQARQLDGEVVHAEIVEGVETT